MSYLITRIEIDGFKSFRQFSLDLEPFQVIVGPNAAGKSNLLDALRFLSKVVTTDVLNAYQEMWASTGELFTILPDRRTADLMSFALELLVEPEVKRPQGNAEIPYTRLRYELTIRRTESAQEAGLTVENERLVGIEEKRDSWSRSRVTAGWERFFRYDTKKSSLLTGTLRVARRLEKVVLVRRPLPTPKVTTRLGAYYG